MLFLSLTLHYIHALCMCTAGFHPDAHTHTQTYPHTQVSPLPLVFVNIKPQNDYLNMTSACLCVNVWRRRAVLFATHTEARTRLAVIFTSAASSPVHTTSDTQRQSDTIPFISMESWRFPATRATATVGDQMGRVQRRDKVQNPSTLCK